VLQPGDVAVDATCGNGHDSLFMAQAIGPTGELHAVDVQVRTHTLYLQQSQAVCVVCYNIICRSDLEHVAATVAAMLDGV
jgi:hypothetical protein